MSRTTRLDKELTAALYNDNRKTSDKQNTKYDNISDTGNSLLSKYSR